MRLSRIVRRSRREVCALAEASVALTMSRALVELPFSWIRPLFGVAGRETEHEPRDAEDRARALEVGRAIAAAARYVPASPTCLPQSLAGRLMLKRRHVPTTTYLGVKKNAEGGIEAHAWLRAYDVIVTGESVRTEYTSIARFA